ncbi:MAG: recombinase family protein [Candidatus Paceibacterota bacterium]
MEKAIIYLRVSSKEQKAEGYSIPAQRKLLLGYAKKNRFEVVQEFEDDETAKSAGRSGFGAMIEYLKANRSIENVLVEKTDRLYRNFKDYVTIDELGITVFLVKENEILGKNASSHQKFIHGIKVLMAKNYVDNLSEEVKKGLKEKADSGIYPGGSMPLGYRLENVNGKSVPVVDEKNRELVIKIFEYYATGLYSIEGLLEKLKSENLIIPENFPRGSSLKTISKSTLCRIIANPFYYGDFMWKGELRVGSHTPLIDRKLWDMAQKVITRFDKNMPIKSGVIDFVYKGLFTCGECGRSITAEKKIKPSGKEYNYYRCTKFQTKCSQKPVSEKIIDEEIANSLEVFNNIPEDTIAYITEGLKQSLALKRATVDKGMYLWEDEKRRLEERLDALYEDKLDGEITREFYQAKSKEYSDKITALNKKISQHTLANIDYYKLGTDILELANKASFLYKNALPDERKELLGFILSNSTLQDKKALVKYKKPFDRVRKRAMCSDWRGRWGSNP